MSRWAWLALGLLACADGPPTPTGSTCPDDSTLTWETFGQPFMESYCVACHSSELHGDERQGAPLYHDFDTLEGVVVVSNHVDERAAAGPEAVNRNMPPSTPRPSVREREDLGEWIACERERAGLPPLTADTTD